MPSVLNTAVILASWSTLNDIIFKHDQAPEFGTHQIAFFLTTLGPVVVFSKSKSCTRECLR
jgi:hypothetical protein